jgi:hypothetical protein
MLTDQVSLILNRWKRINLFAFPEAEFDMHLKKLKEKERKKGGRKGTTKEMEKKCKKERKRGRRRRRRRRITFILCHLSAYMYVCMYVYSRGGPPTAPALRLSLIYLLMCISSDRTSC